MKEKPAFVRRSEVVAWAVQRWRDEVQHRPPENIYRRILDATWRQVIREYGGDDVALIGPGCDDLDADWPVADHAPDR